MIDTDPVSRLISARQQLRCHSSGAPHTEEEDPMSRFARCLFVMLPLLTASPRPRPPLRMSGDIFMRRCPACRTTSNSAASASSCSMRITATSSSGGLGSGKPIDARRSNPSRASPRTPPPAASTSARHAVSRLSIWRPTRSSGRKGTMPTAAIAWRSPPTARPLRAGLQCRNGMWSMPDRQCDHNHGHRRRGPQHDLFSPPDASICVAAHSDHGDRG